MNGTPDVALGADLEPTALLAGATVLYLGFHLGQKAFLGPWRALRRRWLGAVLLGAVPLVLVAALSPRPLSSYGLNLDHAPWSLAVAVATWLGLLPLLSLQARKPAFRAAYPEIRLPMEGAVARWSALGWITYLVGYEAFFRGFLLLGLAPWLGPYVALAVVTMAYVFVHLDKYAGEAIGTIATGVGFGLATLHTGSILMATLAHILVALSGDQLAWRATRRAAATPAA